jgi:iron complex transport system substrate-binding protein
MSLHRQQMSVHEEYAMPPRDTLTIPVPDRVDDIDRRGLLAGAVGVAILAACHQGDGTEDAPAAQTHSFEHFAGTTEIPTCPSRIVTTQDQNALLPLLEIGARPIGSAGLKQADGSHLFRRTQSYDTSEVAFIGDYRAPDLELIAAQRPDLIVGHESYVNFHEALSRIAPTVLIQIFNRPLTGALRQFADVVGALDHWQQLKQDYDRAIASLRAELPRPASAISVSLLQFSTDGRFYNEAQGQAVWTVVTDVGFARPAPQRDVVETTYHSFEQIREHDAAIMLTGNFSNEGWDPGIEAARAQPLLQSLDAVRRGEFHVFDGLAMVGSAFEKMHNFVTFLRATLVERQPNLG